VMFVAFTSMQLQKFQPIGLFFQKTWNGIAQV
jgi:hypothetical protein